MRLKATIQRTLVRNNLLFWNIHQDADNLNKIFCNLRFQY